MTHISLSFLHIQQFQNLLDLSFISIHQDSNHRDQYLTYPSPPIQMHSDPSIQFHPKSETRDLNEKESKHSSSHQLSQSIPPLHHLFLSTPIPLLPSLLLPSSQDMLPIRLQVHLIIISLPLQPFPSHPAPQPLPPRNPSPTRGRHARRQSLEFRCICYSTTENMRFPKSGIEVFIADS